MCHNVHSVYIYSPHAICSEVGDIFVRISRDLNSSGNISENFPCLNKQKESRFKATRTEMIK